jgi:uncharacterized surface protein with fasciclin (FAS1) repeats
MPEETVDMSVLDLAVEAGQFSTLIAAIEAAGLAEALEGEGPFTVLAPTDAAFEAALETLNLTPEELLANPALSDILLYHVLGQAADSSAVAAWTGRAWPPCRVNRFRSRQMPAPSSSTIRLRWSLPI